MGATCCANPGQLPDQKLESVCLNNSSSSRRQPPEEVKDEKLEEGALKIQSQFRVIQAKKQAKYEQSMMDACRPTEQLAKPYKGQILIKNQTVLEVSTKLGPYKYNSTLDQEFPDSRTLEAYVLPDGSIYHGQWFNGEKHGRGKLVSPNDCLYEGYWKSDQFIYGRLIYNTGNYYDGQWENDQANGAGVFQAFKGQKYSGEWLNNIQHGKGVEDWPDGSQFDGEFQQGLRHGEGRFHLGDGSAYEGQFFQGKIEGIGTFKYSDGRRYHGEWKNNKMHGKGEYIWPNGNHYVGYFEDDLRHGYGTYTVESTGQEFTGQWIKGKLSGQSVSKLNS